MQTSGFKGTCYVFLDSSLQNWLAKVICDLAWRGLLRMLPCACARETDAALLNHVSTCNMASSRSKYRILEDGSDVKLNCC
jgi:hypothetical protein